MAVEELLKTTENLPKHVAIIMDGNGRWAEQQGKKRILGHRAGVKAVRETVRLASAWGIESLTLYAFSSENWRRPKQEVNLLMELFFSVLQREVKRLNRNNVRLRIIGDTTAFSEKLQERIERAEVATRDNDGLVLNIAANYGGRWDVVQACRSMVKDISAGALSADDITEENLSSYLSTAGQPEPDLMIRTGGDCRISNFLVWQIAYTEFYFADLLWPDFDETAFANAIAAFVSRERRFGCTGSQIRELLNRQISNNTA